MQQDKTCEVCGVRSAARCGKCKQVYYCGPDHQRSDWSQHKIVCAGVTQSVAAKSTSTNQRTTTQRTTTQRTATQRTSAAANTTRTTQSTTDDTTPHPVNMVYVPGMVRNPTPAAEVIRHSAEAQPLMQLAWPYVLKLGSDVKNFAGRCFISVEIVQVGTNRTGDVQTYPVEGFPYNVHSHGVVDAVRAREYAETAGSAKLVAYCEEYIVGKQLPCVFWCRAPNACYTSLIVPPWVQQEFMNWNDIDKL